MINLFKYDTFQLSQSHLVSYGCNLSCILAYNLTIKLCTDKYRIYIFVLAHILHIRELLWSYGLFSVCLSGSLILICLLLLSFRQFVLVFVGEGKVDLGEAVAGLCCREDQQEYIQIIELQSRFHGIFFQARNL